MTTSITGPSGSSQSTFTQQTSDVQTDTSPVAVWDNLGFARLTPATLGLHLPQNPEDAEAILAQVSQELENTIGKLRDQREQAIADRVVAARGGILGTLQSLTTTGLKLIDEKAQLTKKQADLETEKTKLSKDQQTLSAATDANTAAVSVYNYWNNQVASIDQSTDPAGYANAVSQRSAAAQNVTTTQAAKNAAQQTVNDDNAAIAKTEAEIAALQQSIDQDTAVYNALQTALVSIMALADQAVLGANTANSVNTSTDLGRDQVMLREFDKIFDGLRDLANSQEARDLQKAFDQRQLVDKDTVERFAQAVIGLLPGATPLPSPFDIGQSAFANPGGSRLKIPL
jgi:hypothetical protein